MKCSYTEKWVQSSPRAQRVLVSSPRSHNPGRRCRRRSRGPTRTAQGWRQRHGRSQGRMREAVASLVGQWWIQRSSNCLTWRGKCKCVCCLTYYRKGESVLCWALSVFHYKGVAARVLWISLCYDQCAAPVCVFCPQLWTVHYLQVSDGGKTRECVNPEKLWREKESYNGRERIYKAQHLLFVSDPAGGHRRAAAEGARQAGGLAHFHLQVLWGVFKV